MNSRVFAALLLAVLVAGLVFAPSARADSQVRIVRLSLVDGAVQIDRGTGQGFEKAIMNMPITQGMMVTTPDGARAEIEFENGSSLRLAPGTRVAFPLLGLRASGAYLTTVQLDQGTAYFNLRHKGDDDFRVAFGNREIAVDRNVHFRLDLTGGNPELAVFKGELDVKGPLAQAKVKKNETMTFDLADPARYDLAKNIVPEPYDSWDNERIDYASQYASSSYNTHSPYSYGASDLNYYGSWASWPGYGRVWRPFGVGYGWDPFYNGAWAWYPGFGYTWVSTYPWGWTPYRYGSWIFVPNYGWCWRPGVWNTWYTVPPVYNAPPFYHGPKPPPPVTVVGAGSTTTPPPTVVVNNGVGFVHNPRTTGDAVIGSRGSRFELTSPSNSDASASTSATPVVRSTTPAPGTGIVAPSSPVLIHSGRTDMRGRGVDADSPRGGQRTAPPAPRPMDRSVPRAVPPRTAAPPPRVSSPPPARMSAPPAPRSSAPSGGGHHSAPAPAGRSQQK